MLCHLINIKNQHCHKYGNPRKQIVHFKWHLAAKRKLVPLKSITWATYITCTCTVYISNTSTVPVLWTGYFYNPISNALLALISPYAWYSLYSLLASYCWPLQGTTFIFGTTCVCFSKQFQVIPRVNITMGTKMTSIRGMGFQLFIFCSSILQKHLLKICVAAWLFPHLLEFLTLLAPIFIDRQLTK